MLSAKRFPKVWTTNFYQLHHCTCFSSASCKNKYIKASKVFFSPKAVRNEINSSHCHLMSCRELPVTLLPHIPLCVKKSLYLITLHLSSHHPPHILPPHLNNLHLKTSESKSVLHKQHTSHKAVLLFIAQWEMIDALSIDSSSKAKAHNVRVVFSRPDGLLNVQPWKGRQDPLIQGLCVTKTMEIEAGSTLGNNRKVRWICLNDSAEGID